MRQPDISTPALFRGRLFIDTANGGTARLADVMDAWQIRDFEALDAAWMRAAGLSATEQPNGLAAKIGDAFRRAVALPPDGVPCRAYLERPRGHSKTGDLACMASWALLAARRQILIVVAAGDRDQARLLRDAIERLVSLNPWMPDLLDVQSHRVVNRRTGSTLEILSADAASSYGLTPDAILVDELTHWPDGQGERLWHSLFSAAAKRDHCLLCIISNAGTGQGDSWQWHVREAARTDGRRWYFSRLDGPVASWISPEHLAEQAAILPAAVYERLFLNLWRTSGAGDALLPADFDRSLTLRGPSGREEGYRYVAGVDGGLSHDSAVLVVVGKIGTRYKVCRVWEWRPPKGGKIDLDAVEKTVIEAHREYHFRYVAADPWQLAQLVQRCRKSGVPIEERPQSGGKLVEQASALIEAFTSGSIDLYDHSSLTRDLRSLRVEERQYGYRLVSSRGSDGHGDRASALSIALAVAKELPVSRPFEASGWMDGQTYSTTSPDKPVPATRPSWATRFISSFARGEDDEYRPANRAKMVSDTSIPPVTHIDTSRPENQQRQPPPPPRNVHELLARADRTMDELGRVQ